MKTSELIGEARDHLYQGWCQNSYRDGEGNVCVVGALKRASMNNLMNGGIQAFEPAKERVLKKLKEVLAKENHLYGIPSLNDDDETTKDDVLNAMDKACIESEEHGD